MLKQRRVELEDRIFRAYGLLGQCRLLSSKEALSFLATLRLGVSLGILAEPPLHVITALMILSQKAHVQKMLDAADDETDNKLVDYTRAKTVRRVLSGRALEEDDV
jgi:protein arginine kinase